MTPVQIEPRRVAGVELQPLAQLSESLGALADAFGWDVRFESDDQLGPLSVVALEVEGVQYLLRTYRHSPECATEIHSPNSGDPTEQLRQLLAHIPLVADHLQYWWDGASWREAPLPHAA